MIFLGVWWGLEFGPNSAGVTQSRTLSEWLAYAASPPWSLFRVAAFLLDIGLLLKIGRRPTKGDVFSRGVFYLLTVLAADLAELPMYWAPLCVAAGMLITSYLLADPAVRRTIAIGGAIIGFFPFLGS
jgi:hypothetical protein